MKLKKLLNVMTMSQSIRFVTSNGTTVHRSPVVCLANQYDRPFINSMEKYQVHSIRHVHDDFQPPEFQDYIEITIIGENDND